MALLHIDLKRFNAGQKGVPITAHTRYLLRQMPMDEHVKHALRQRPSERQRDDLVASGHLHMPDWAQGQELTYWQAAQDYSRKGGVVARELEISLPREFTRAQNLALIQQWVQALPACPTTWVFHDPKARNGQDQQPHMHILISPRPNDGRVRDPRTYFKQPSHGGVPARQLWTKRGEMRQLWKDWEQVLRATLRAHGLEQALQRNHPDKEIALHWQEMKQLERVMKQRWADAWGHEYRLTGGTIQQWHQAGHITLRQATWLAQRGQRQAAWQILQHQSRLWDVGDTLTKARPWQFATKHQARKARHQIEATIQGLQQQRHQLGQVYLTWCTPALRAERDRYRQTQAHRQRQRGRWSGRQVTRGQGAHLYMQLAHLDETLERRQVRARQQAHGWER
jgi:hypothetical protein